MSYAYADADIVRCLGANTQPIGKINSVQCHSNRCVPYTYTDTGIGNVRHIICILCWHRHSQMSPAAMCLIGSLWASTQAIFRNKVQCYRDRCVSYMYTDTGIDNVVHICWHRHSQMSPAARCLIGSLGANTQSIGRNKVSPTSQWHVCVIYIHWHRHRQCHTHMLTKT